MEQQIISEENSKKEIEFTEESQKKWDAMIFLLENTKNIAKNRCKL